MMANKSTAIARFQKAIQTPCAYCNRIMVADRPGLLPTRDHTHPRSRGGLHTVWACDDCNNIKSDMTMPEWQEFMSANPSWWKRRNNVSDRRIRLTRSVYEAQTEILTWLEGLGHRVVY